MGYLGTQELLIIGAIVLLLFGGARIPTFAKGLGEALREFKKSLNGEEEEAKATPQAAQAAQPATKETGKQEKV